jgi:hypothetical protein
MPCQILSVIRLVRKSDREIGQSFWETKEIEELKYIVEEEFRSQKSGAML